MLELTFQIIAVIAATLAAWLWYKSTKVPVPISLGVPIIPPDDALSRDNPEKRWARETSEKNRRAALATAVSVGAQGLAVAVSVWPQVLAMLSAMLAAS